MLVGYGVTCPCSKFGVCVSLLGCFCWGLCALVINRNGVRSLRIATPTALPCSPSRGERHAPCYLLHMIHAEIELFQAQRYVQDSGTNTHQCKNQDEAKNMEDSDFPPPSPVLTPSLLLAAFLGKSCMSTGSSPPASTCRRSLDEEQP